MISAISSAINPQLAASSSASSSSRQSQSSAQSSVELFTADTYTPSSEAASPGIPVYSANAFYSGLPQAISNGMSNLVYTPDADWKALQTALNSGDIDASKKALTTYTQALADSNLSMSTLTAPSQSFEDYLSQIGADLNAGNLTGAQTVFGMAQWQQPTSPLFAMATAITQAALDGSKSSQWQQDLVNFAATVSPDAASYNTSNATVTLSTGSTADDKLASDLEVLQSALHEADSNIGDYLRSQGYSAANVSSIVAVLDYSNFTGMLRTVTGDIAYDTHNTDQFTVSSSVASVTASDTGSSVAVHASTDTFQGSSSVGSSASISASAESGNVGDNAGNTAYVWSFSIVESGSDGKSTEYSTTNSLYRGASAASEASSDSGVQLSLSTEARMLADAAAQQTAKEVQRLISSPVEARTADEDPSKTKYALQMSAGASSLLNQTESIATGILGSGKSVTGSSTNSMSAYDGTSEASASMSVYA